MKSFVLDVMSKAAGQKVVSGQKLDLEFDYAMVHDGSVVLARKYIEEKGVEKLWCPERTFLIFDHIWPPNNELTASLHRVGREFASEHGLRFYEGGSGICHQILLESDLIESGTLLAGGDSHTTTIGARSVVGIGFGARDMADIIAEGRTWMKIPEVIRLNLNGSLPAGVYAKDVALAIAGTFGTSFATYRAIEYKTDFAFTLSDKAAICNMAAEFGAKAAVFLPEGWTDEGDDPLIELNLDLSALEPLVAKPSTVDNVCAAEGVTEKIDVAVVGTCTGGRYQDFSEAAETLAGRSVAPGVRLLICPASKTVYKKLCEDGLAETFIDAGATVLPPGCGPCLGMHDGALAPHEVAVSTANRNFIGRMGSNKAEIYLASPATVASSAVAGHIATAGVAHSTGWQPRSQDVSHLLAYPEKSVPNILKEIGFDSAVNRVWEFGDNVDTDVIIAGKYLRTDDTSVWREHALEAADPHFAREVKEGDVIVAGDNFGCGSSREQAAIALKLCGLKAIIANYCARIFYRNCVHIGLDIY